MRGKKRHEPKEFHVAFPYNYAQHDKTSLTIWRNWKQGKGIILLILISICIPMNKNEVKSNRKSTKCVVTQILYKSYV